MKKILFLAAIIIGCLSIKIADAQIRVSLNIGSQPEWGPTGYDHADYYYMPDIDAYYDVSAHQYVYYDNNVWVHNAVLPARYHFDKYHSYKVVVNDRNPWERHDVYRTRYASYRGRHDQALIRESHDARYRNHYREAAVHENRIAAQNHKAAIHNNKIAARNHEVAKHNARTTEHIHREEQKEHKRN